MPRQIFRTAVTIDVERFRRFHRGITSNFDDRITAGGKNLFPGNKALRIDHLRPFQHGTFPHGRIRSHRLVFQNIGRRSHADRSKLHILITEHTVLQQFRIIHRINVTVNHIRRIGQQCPPDDRDDRFNTGKVHSASRIIGIHHQHR